MHDRWVYQRLIEGLPDSAFVVDAAGTIFAINRLAAARFGWDQDQVIGAAIWRRFDQDSWSILCARWRVHGEAPEAPDNGYDDATPDAKQSLAGLSCAVSPLPVGGTPGALITVRDSAAETCSSDQALLDGLLTNTLFPLIHVDAQLNIVQVNDAFATLVGVPTTHLLQRHLATLPLNSDLVKALTQAVHREHSAVGSAAPLLDGFIETGRTYWDWCVRPITRLDHTVCGAVLLMADATARVRAEAAVKQSLLEWTVAMDALEDSIYLLDLEERVVRANRAFYKLTGLTSEQTVGRKITSIMHPNGEERPCPVCDARMQRKDTYLVMEPDHPNNKTGRPNEIMIRVIRDDRGNDMGMLMAIRDLSRARQTENEFRRLNQHIHLLLDSTGEGIIGLDEYGRCTFVNHAAARLLGYTPEELVGRDLFDQIHSRYENGAPVARDDCPMLRTISEQCSFSSNEHVLWRKNNLSFSAQYLSNPVIENGRVTGAVVVFRDVTETRGMTRRLDYLARHDALTGLYNRHEFERRLQAALHDQLHDGCIVAYLDLDQFKVVNDTCGHAAGDELLQQLSALLKANVPENATLARLGGDEFGLLLQGRSLPAALDVIHALRDLMRKFRFGCEDKTFAIGASVGVVPLRTTAGTLSDVMRHADAACYLAKESGRNRVHVFQPDDAELTRRHREMQWVTRVQQALEHDQFELFYQCIHPTNAPTVRPNRFFEILIRMRDGGGNWIRPEVFLPAAERYNLMPAVDRWVVANVCAWMRHHREQIHAIEMCTINLSGHSLSDDAFLDYVVRELRDNHVPPSIICFEVTETAAVANLAHALRFIKELRQLGCRFALDDFGSGMSSFAYLKNLPVDYLKIDGNFVRDIVDDPVDFAMVEAINKVGHVMGIQTIAEFVESDVVRDKLQEIGIDFVQGTRIAPPVPLDHRIFELPTCQSIAAMAQ